MKFLKFAEFINTDLLFESIKNISVLKKYRKELNKLGITLTFEETAQNTLLIKIIEVPAELRGTGEGKRAMNSVIQWADDNKIILHLTPAGGSIKSRKWLVSFYSNFGFIVNKRDTKDYIEDLHYMYRLPK